jgi:hypothetical protein
MTAPAKLLRLGPVLLAVLLAAGCGGHTALQTVNASNPNSPAAPAAPGASGNPDATTVPNIQKLGGWENCTVCTGAPHAIYSMAQNVASPSESGASAKFQMLPGTLPFGGALWFKFLGAADSATHFVYDLYFYADNPSAPQALEFNVTQSMGNGHYDFSTQCDFTDQRVWRIWDPIHQQWVASSVPCVQPPPKTWNHLVWEFERNSSGQAVFTAVTLNGNRSVVNIAMPHTPDKNSGLDIAFQADANHTATPYSVWLDKISLTYW